MVAWAAFVPQRWLYRQRIATAGAVTRLALDRAVYDGAGDSLADLRVVRDGAEVPYLLDAAYAKQQTTEAPVRVVNKETRAGTLYATLELDASPEPHNQLQLAVTRDDFRSQLSIEASDDGRTWATVRQAAYIFRYRTDDGQAAEHTTLRYPDSRRRYLRLAIAQWPNAAEFTGASVRRDASTSASRSEIWSAREPAVEARNRSTCAVFATGTRTPRDTAVLAIAQPPTFHRSVTVEQSEDGRRWSWLGTGALYRISGEESLTVTFPETRAPQQRLCVFQGDDQAVKITSVQLLGVDRVVAFRSDGPGGYWLYYGATNAARPEYDLAQTAGRSFFASAQAGSLGAREANPAYQAPVQPLPPWTERYPALLYTVLALAVGGLGWLALRLLPAT